MNIFNKLLKGYSLTSLKNSITVFIKYLKIC